MADDQVVPDVKRTLTDDQIVTEKKVARRSFLTGSGALLAGAAALASTVAVRAVAADDPRPDDRHKRRADSDQHPGDRDCKRNDPDVRPDSDRCRGDRKPHDPA